MPILETKFARSGTALVLDRSAYSFDAQVRGRMSVRESNRFFNITIPPSHYVLSQQPWPLSPNCLDLLLCRFNATAFRRHPRRCTRRGPPQVDDARLANEVPHQGPALIERPCHRQAGLHCPCRPLASIIAYRREICAGNLKPRHLRYPINRIACISSAIRFGSPVFLSSGLMTHQNALRLGISMGRSVTREIGRR